MLCCRQDPPAADPGRQLYVAPRWRQARALVRRHLAGEPVAYLIGEWGFGLPLILIGRCLSPGGHGRPPRWIVLCRFLQNSGSRVLDLCAGECIRLAVASQVGIAG